MSTSALLRPLFLLPPEPAHHVALAGLDTLAALRLLRAPAAPAGAATHVLGLDFPNRIGLAAGLDKNADHIDALGALGFGFIEVGTVTPRAQPGNPKPRLFRLPEQRALINRLGFNNKGVDHAVARLQRRRYRGVVGVNIGKNRDTPLADALGDYAHCLERVHAVADYVVVNVSSPNTPGLRDLQGEAALDALLGPLSEQRARLDAAAGRRVPLLVKIAPDLDPTALDAIAAAVQRHGIDGIVATNTTSERSAVSGARHAAETGGLSGPPLLEPSTRVLAGLAERLGGTTPLIGVGGVSDAAAARAKLDAGASLIQIYTGLIYEGPGLVPRLVAATAG